LLQPGLLLNENKISCSYLTRKDSKEQGKSRVLFLLHTVLSTNEREPAATRLTAKKKQDFSLHSQ